MASSKIVLLVFALAASCEANYLRTVVDPVSSAAYWDYSDGPAGPEHWGDLSEEYHKCKDGQNQSPIDIDTSDLKLDGTIDVPAIINYTNSSATVMNTGKAIELVWHPGMFNVHEQDFALTHIVFHSPSEHTIDGKRFPLETQLVHVNIKGEYAINVVLSDYGPSNGWLEQFWNQIPSIVGAKVPVGILSADGFKVNYRKYYRYIGSLTYPDCREYVVWSVLQTIYEVSKEQVEHIRSLLPGPNVRPIQPLGGRRIYYPRKALDD